MKAERTELYTKSPESGARIIEPTKKVLELANTDAKNVLATEKRLEEVELSNK